MISYCIPGLGFQSIQLHFEHYKDGKYLIASIRYFLASTFKLALKFNQVLQMGIYRETWYQPGEISLFHLG